MCNCFSDLSQNNLVSKHSSEHWSHSNSLGKSENQKGLMASCCTYKSLLNVFMVFSWERNSPRKVLKSWGMENFFNPYVQLTNKGKFKITYERQILDVRFRSLSRRQHEHKHFWVLESVRQSSLILNTGYVHFKFFILPKL